MPAEHPEPHPHRHPSAGSPIDSGGRSSVGPSIGVEDAGALALDEALRTSFRIIKFLMVVLVVFFLASGLFTVNPNELAIRLSFGRPVGTGADQLLKPGLHWAFPYPIDEVVRVPVGESRTLISRTGWFATTPEEEKSGQLPVANPYLQPGVDGYTLTGDGNIIHAKTTLKYRLQPSGVQASVFAQANLTNLLQNLLDNSMHHAAVRSSADDALYLKVSAFKELVTQRFKQHLEERRIDLIIETLEVQTMAPLAVKPAFDEVTTTFNSAITETKKAEIEARTMVNSALGQAAVIQNDGFTRSNQLVSSMANYAKSFEELRPHYEANPTLFKQRLLSETLQHVFTNAQEKFFVPYRTDNRPRELRLQLSREPFKPKTADNP
jgi:modulator of FtsH protease HflK